MKTWLVFFAVLVLCIHSSPATCGEITRIWLSHRTHEPAKMVINWESDQPGNSIVHFRPNNGEWRTIEVKEEVTLHHVEIPLDPSAIAYQYSVQTGDQRSAASTFKTYASEILKVAIVADWHSKPKLDAITQDGIQLLLTAGDNIPALHPRCGKGEIDCTKPYGELIAAYPELFCSVPFMPVLGNHDREIRPRGSQPPLEPVYDVEATAYRRFFELPDDEWKWYFDIPKFGVRFIALDLNHIQDIGTTWQTCHPYGKGSEQFRWYEQLMMGKSSPFVVTLHNENNSSMRSKEGGAWHKMFSQGTIAVTGFGYYAERAEVEGFSYYNTALGVGAKYPDRQSKFFESAASYLLLTITKQQMAVELKGLDGRVLDRKEFQPKR